MLGRQFAMLVLSVVGGQSRFCDCCSWAPLELSRPGVEDCGPCVVGELLSAGSVAADASDDSLGDVALGAAGTVALGGALEEELDGAVCAEARPPKVMPARARTSS